MKKWMMLLFVSLFVLTGCETMHGSSQADRAARTQDHLLIQEQQRRLSGRIESLELEIEQLNRDLVRLREQQDARARSLEQKMEADKRDMIARITGEIERLLRQQAAAAPAPAPRTQQHGIEHTVRPGETLSTIAQAYNVTPRVLTEANRIQNPDVLRVGQKLFIPQ